MAGASRIAGLAAAAAAFCGSCEAVRAVLQLEAYDEFRQQFGVYRSDDDVDYVTRAALFQRRQEEVERHNAEPGVRWRAAVNKFADFTEAEFKALLGHRPARQGRWQAAAEATASARQPAPASLLEVEAGLQPDLHGHMAAEHVDWASQTLAVQQKVQDQGACGSCWAVAAEGAISFRAALKGHRIPQLSYEELVDCVENVKHCGGTGGCKGATPEMAFAYVNKTGLHTMANYRGGYQHGGNAGNCQAAASGPPDFHIQGYVRLEENNAAALKAALMHGPVVVSVAASAWHSYASGVFDSCDKDSIVNHAVLMTGFGTEEHAAPYYTIRNSWGPNWGESGYIRLLRDESSEAYCGLDTDAQAGVACENDPTEVKVCGMCGILADSSYPVIE